MGHTDNQPCPRCGLTYADSKRAMWFRDSHSPEGCVYALKEKAKKHLDLLKANLKWVAVVEKIGEELGVFTDLSPREFEARVLAGIKGLRDQLPYPADEGQTHYDGCHVNRGHHNCAVQVIQRANLKLRELGERIIRLDGLLEHERCKTEEWRLVEINGGGEGRFWSIQFHDFSVVPYRSDWEEMYGELAAGEKWDKPCDGSTWFGRWRSPTKGL